MRNLTFILLFVVTIFGDAVAQQLPFTTQFTDNRAVWNPAATGLDTKMKISGFMRQQWLGIEGAPRTIFASIEYPFLDYNMSGGAVLFNDATGPISKTGIQLMYSYKLQELLGRDDQLSFGLQAMFSQFAFNSAGEQFNQSGDPLISGNNQSESFPTIGAGFFYITNTETWDNNTVFYIGGAMQQAYSSNLLVGSADFERTSHLFFNMGTKIYTYDFMIEPFVNFNYTTPELLNYSLNVNVEFEDLFWAGAGFANTGEFNMQGGYIFDDFGGRDKQLKLGVLANIIPSDAAVNLGPGFEFFAAYTFDLD